MRENESYGSAGIGFMDGAYMPISEMRLPVTDMGFQLGDMCYDAIHVHKGRFFRMRDHLDRWEQSVSKRRYDSLHYDREQVAEVLHGCVARSGLKEAMITFAATRGSPTTAHKDLRTCKNRFMVWAVPYYNVFSRSRGRDRKRHHRRQDHPHPIGGGRSHNQELWPARFRPRAVRGLRPQRKVCCPARSGRQPDGRPWLEYFRAPRRRVDVTRQRRAGRHHA